MIARTLVWLAVLGVGASALADGEDPLAACHQANDDFDYDGVITECTAGLEVAGITRETRIEAYRMLGVAHTTLNDEDAAVDAFLKLLAIDPAHDLGPAVSPVYRDMFNRARAALEEKGRVTADWTLEVGKDDGGPWVATAQVTDPMARVHGATLLVRALRGPAEVGRVKVAMTEEAGEGRTFSGSVQDPAPAEIEGDYSLEVTLTVQDGAGNDLALPDATGPRAFPRTGAGAESGSGLWLGIGGGGAAAVAAVVLVAGGTAVVVTGCVLTGACGGGGEATPSSHVRVGPAL